MADLDDIDPTDLPAWPNDEEPDEQPIADPDAVAEVDQDASSAQPQDGPFLPGDDAATRP